MFGKSKFLLIIFVFCGICLIASADRGGFIKKGKTKLNIATTSSLKNSISFNLRSQINYRGSYLLQQTRTGNTIVTDEILSYKKGNTIYLVPYKQKILIPQYTQGEGYKLIIRSRK